MAGITKDRTRHVTASQARQRFGSVCEQAKHGPVFVERAGQVDTVILSAKQYQALVAAPTPSAMSARQAAFDAAFSRWIAAQNALIESAGIPGADLRPW